MGSEDRKKGWRFLLFGSKLSPETDYHSPFGRRWVLPWEPSVALAETPASNQSPRWPSCGLRYTRQARPRDVSNTVRRCSGLFSQSESPSTEGVVRLGELLTCLCLFGSLSLDLELLSTNTVNGFLQIMDLVLTVERSYLSVTRRDTRRAYQPPRVRWWNG